MSAWLGLTAHRPLGSIMRARKAAYAMGAQFRQEHNKQPIKKLKNQGHAGTDLPLVFPSRIAKPSFRSSRICRRWGQVLGPKLTPRTILMLRPSPSFDLGFVRPQV